MLKHLINGSSLLAIALRDGNDDGAPEPTEREKARAAIMAKATVVTKDDEKSDDKESEDDNKEGDEKNDEDEDEDEDKEDDKEELDADGNPIVKEDKELTAEEKEAKEQQEREAAKAARKEQRVQARIDKAVSAQRIAENRVAELEAQLKADPDKTLTKEEVQRQAKLIADEAIAAKEVERVQLEFNATCDKLQEAAVKIDPKFTPKVVAMCDELGPIPSRIIGILSDLDNGPEILKLMVDDIDEAEKLYDLKNKPERLAIALVRISDKLEVDKKAAAKPKPKQLSKVPDPTPTVKGSRVQSTVITEADTRPEGMHNYRAKRMAQIEARRKAGG